MQNPLISIVIPVYGVEAVLPRCLDSVLRQTYRDLEIILIDDASPDRCCEICDSYAERDARIRVIHRAENGGISAVRNDGLDAASGTYLAFVDSDDYVEPDFIEFLYGLLIKYDADISGCGALIHRVNGRVDASETFEETFVMSPKDAVERMCYNNKFYITLWDKLYRRSLFDGLRFPIGKQFEDTALTPIVASRARCLVANGLPKYHYVYFDRSITNCEFSRKKLDYLDAADQMAAFVVSSWPDLKPAAERKQLHAEFSTLCQLVNSSTRDRELESVLMRRIRSRQRSVFWNRKAAFRDKIAILSLLFGYPVFRFAWKCYRKVKKGL